VTSSDSDRCHVVEVTALCSRSRDKLANQMTEPAIALNQADSPELVTLARALFREYAAAIDIDLEYQGFEAELAALPAPYVPPEGALLIARAGNEAAGCVALRPLAARIGEMKRLYVRPAYRNTGLGRRLVETVIDAARRAGCSELRLDTLPRLSSALALYQRLGFKEIPPYNSSYLPGTRFYVLELTSRDGTSARTGDT
jgi:putative acetyltransferase